jgi:hypothetical protein
LVGTRRADRLIKEDEEGNNLPPKPPSHVDRLLRQFGKLDADERAEFLKRAAEVM